MGAMSGMQPFYERPNMGYNTAVPPGYNTSPQVLPAGQ